MHKYLESYIRWPVCSDQPGQNCRWQAAQFITNQIEFACNHIKKHSANYHQIQTDLKKNKK